MQVTKTLLVGITYDDDPNTFKEPVLIVSKRGNILEEHKTIPIKMVVGKKAIDIWNLLKEENI